MPGKLAGNSYLKVCAALQHHYGPVARHPPALNADRTSPRREASLLNLPVIQCVTGNFFEKLELGVTPGVTAAQEKASPARGEAQGPAARATGHRRKCESNFAFPQPRNALRGCPDPPRKLPTRLQVNCRDLSACEGASPAAPDTAVVAIKNRGYRMLLRKSATLVSRKPQSGPWCCQFESEWGMQRLLASVAKMHVSARATC